MGNVAVAEEAADASYVSQIRYGVSLLMSVCFMMRMSTISDTWDQVVTTAWEIFRFVALAATPASTQKTPTSGHRW